LDLFIQGANQIGEDSRIKFEQGPGEIILVCRAAERGDQGRYLITLKNPKGSDTATVNVIILDKPGSPEGPLEVTKITADGCKLAWNPPKVRIFIISSNLYFHFIFTIRAEKYIHNF